MPSIADIFQVHENKNKYNKKNKKQKEQKSTTANPVNSLFWLGHSGIESFLFQEKNNLEK